MGLIPSNIRDVYHGFEVDENAEDDVIEVIRSDGSKLRVLIPKPSASPYFDKCIAANPDVPFGLSFVTDGHYC